ncbi:uncharacterized protein LOC108744986 [Agrilus planipennis]|uniref:Uncharacterized protein LOC108744986 n=1 Tax=Agrilus planipennis TaxID=224129 RepID=A0A1W4XVM9_AGRPL|nr:uncharacterized protein LOC108744986 [Agrilus planipennis]
MFKQLFAVVFLALISSSYSQYVSRGQCEDRKIKPVEQFPLIGVYGGDQFLRRWFTVFTSNIEADCQELNFRRRTKSVNESQFTLSQKDVLTGKRYPDDDGVISLGNYNGEKVVDVKFNNTEGVTQFRILGYNNNYYTIDYNCVNINSTHRRELLYARSRYRNYIDSTAKEVDKILNDNGLADIKRKYANQDLNICF